MAQQTTRLAAARCASRGSPFRKARASVERASLRKLLTTAWLRDWLAATRREPVDGRTIDPDIAMMLRMDDLRGNPTDLRRLSPPQARARFAANIRLACADGPPGVVVEDRKLPVGEETIVARVYVPENARGTSPAVIYFQGGGWVTGSLETHDPLCRRIAHGVRGRVVAVQYRLAPEHRFPTAAEDCVAATRWILEHAAQLGIDAHRVALAGDSAGGNLSAVVARRTSRDVRRPALQALVYPALDATFAQPSYTTFARRYFLTRPMCEWYYAYYLGDADRRHPDASPLLAPDLPDVPALVYTAGFDPMRDEGRAYADRLREAGTPVVYKDFASLTHGFMLMTLAPAALAATDEIVAAIRDRL